MTSRENTFADNRSSNDLRFAGDVTVDYIIITSLTTGNTLNVTNQVLTVNIYEDLFSPFITGNLILSDSLDLINIFPMMGEEIITLRISTPTLNNDTCIQGIFYIYKMSDREEIADSNRVYQLHFISKEAITDINTKISKSYSGKISDIVKDILTSDEGLELHEGDIKNYVIEDTSNHIKYVSNYWNPVKNLFFLTDHAKNIGDNSVFVFFENRNGFNFRSLDGLNQGEVIEEFYQDNSDDSINKASSGSRRVLKLDYRRIIELTIPVEFDYIDRVSQGMYGSTMFGYDLTTKIFSKKQFNMFTEFGGSRETRTNKYPISSRGIKASYESLIMNDVIESNMFDSFGDVSNIRTIQKRISRFKQLESNKIQIVVPGRVDYTVGQIVKVKTFKRQPMTDSDVDIKDGILSGKYLVSAIHHNIDRTKHECIMELVRDSIDVNLDSMVGVK